MFSWVWKKVAIIVISKYSKPKYEIIYGCKCNFLNKKKKVAYIAQLKSIASNGRYNGSSNAVEIKTPTSEKEQRLLSEEHIPESRGKRTMKKMRSELKTSVSRPAKKWVFDFDVKIYRNRQGLSGYSTHRYSVSEKIQSHETAKF